MTDSDDLPALPRELVSLIHHVELHKSGWWDRVLERIVLIAIWHKSSIAIDDLVVFLGQGLDNRIDRSRIDSVVAREVASGSLIQLTNGSVKVSEEVGAVFDKELAVIEVSEAELRSHFSDLSSKYHIEAAPSDLWNDFEALFIKPLVRESGARLYEFATNSSNGSSEIPSFSSIVLPLC